MALLIEQQKSDTVINQILQNEHFRSVVSVNDLPSKQYNELPDSLQIPLYTKKNPIGPKPDVIKNPHLAAKHAWNEAVNQETKIKIKTVKTRSKKNNPSRSRKKTKLKKNVKFVSCEKTAVDNICNQKIYYIHPKGEDVFFSENNLKKLETCTFKNVLDLKLINYYNNPSDICTLIYGSESKVTEPNKIICWIASKNLNAKISKQQWQSYQAILELCCTLKYNIPRSDKKNNFFQYYVCHGFRMDYILNEIGEYRYKKQINSELGNALSDNIINIITQLEIIAFPFFNNTHSHQFHMGCEQLDIPTIVKNGIFTKFELEQDFVVQYI